ncbi:MAG: amidohydrolase family protein, partial [Syntrophorhabdaceae bacterium]|nr:amidohydrolase family protein [Syntrophorhabdaceae bacterium]
AHLGGGLCFYEFMPEVKEAFKNVFYDTAASPFLYSNDIYKFLGKFLKEKVIFGTDYPLLTTKRYLKGMETLDLETQEMILSKNARRLFERT